MSPRSRSTPAALQREFDAMVDADQVMDWAGRLYDDGQVDDAEEVYGRGWRRFPAVAELGLYWAACRMMQLDLDGWQQRLEEVLARHPDEAEAHGELAVVLGLRCDFAAADAALARATALDPERFPAPVRVPEEEFVRWVTEAGDRLPSAVRRHLDDVLVRVVPVPPMALLRELAADGDVDPGLLGLFAGAALGEEPVPGEPSPRIWLFQRNLEAMCRSPDELRQQVVITLYHELGHYLGLDEDGVDRLGLG